MPNINKNIIKQAGAAVANATNKAAGLYASTPEPGTIISAIQLVNGGRKIGPADVVHFTESVRNKLLSLLVSMDPIQDFNGYGHPWPAGGGANLFAPYTQNSLNGGIAYSVNSNGTIHCQGTATSNSYSGTNLTYSEAPIVLSAGTYTVSAYGFSATGGAQGYMSFGARYSDGTLVQPGGIRNSASTITLEQDAHCFYWIYVKSGRTINEDISIQVEKGSTATSWTPYSNICPISGRAGANAYISPTHNVADATTYAADWTTPAGTVYAGSADIVTGNIKAAPYYASYNGETLVGPWVSSMDVYDPDGTPTTGAQVVDLGGTMTDYHITGQDIITLVGDNYIWSDSGDVTITE